ncbi:hypothetical protein BDY19DRAFT_931391 [Irpex rosettiformis]|uniref:Uncharacterized protein n=1 Tax=Irpex rosettiformis TaxID=378272 RepID=A0ACB8UBK9_9APHY|nr:hypothetical protein BDY19DRAFT_931391 [Irpex rosettiformis]
MRSSPGSPSESSLRRSTPPQPGPSTYTRAPKGKACLNCRRRKLKCDCARPVCSQCVRYGRERDCEYTDKHQLSRTEMLEETIATLQAKLQELEHTEDGNSPPVGIGHAQYWGSGVPGRSSPRASQSPRPSGYAAPTFDESRALLDAFLPYCTDVGFFLNPNRFLHWLCPRLSPTSQDVLGNQPVIIPEQTSPLIWAAFAWGATFTDEPDLKQHAELYASKAIQLLCTTSPSNGSDLSRPTVLHFIQSEVLVATYLLNSGEFVQARQHISSAASIVWTYGLHKIRSHPIHDPSLMRSIPSSDAATALPPPTDSVEEGERISALWQVYILDKTWSAVLGKPGMLNDGVSPLSCIDTPWPLAVEQYVEGPVPPDYGVSGRTLHKFLYESQAFQPVARLPTLALRAQAAALLDRALFLSSSCALDPTLRAFHSTEFDGMEALLNRFILFLNNLWDSQAQHSTEWARNITITQCIARLATMQLHFAWFEDDIKSATKVMNACKAIIDHIQLLPPLHLRHIDPLLPVMLTSVAQVCCNEQLRMQNPTMYKRQLLTCNHPFWLEHAVAEVGNWIAVINGDSNLSAIQRETVRSFLSALMMSNSPVNIPLESV